MKRVLIILSLLSYSVLYAQDGDFTLPTLDDMVKVPPSPEAQAFTKYGNLGVSLYTGAPDVKIPIHTIKGREIELPVFLTYDASGIKVNQIASWVGLGWNLNAGGVVTRQVNGMPDDYLDNSVISPYSLFYNSGISPHFLYYSSSTKTLFDKYKNFTPAPNTNYLDVLVDLKEYFQFTRDVKQRKIETQPDSYSFSINGLSGTIFIDYDSSTGYVIDQPDLKVEPFFQNGLGSNTSKIIISWRITDKFGTTYTFNNAETTEEYESFGLGENSESTRKYNSSWYVSEIRTKNNRDIINFNYTSPQEWTNKQIAGVGESRREAIEQGCPFYGTILPGTKEYKITQFDLDNIVVNGTTEIEFISSSSYRSDLHGKKSLNKIQINNIEGNRKRLIDLNNDTYFGTVIVDERDIRLKLASVDFYGRIGDSTPEQTYTFEYYSNGPFPSRFSKAQDYWGYFNGQEVNNSRGTLVPYMVEFDSNNPGFNGAIREPDIAYSKVGSMSKITYPTGGSTEFHYKLHRTNESNRTESEEDYFAANIIFANGGIDESDPYGYVACDERSYEKPKGLEQGFWLEKSGDVTVNFNVYGASGLTSDGISYVAFYKTGEGCWLTSASPTGTICDAGPPQSFCTTFDDGSVPFEQYGNFISPMTIQQTFHLDSGYYQTIMLNSNEETSMHLTVEARRVNVDISNSDVGGLRTYKLVDKTDASAIARTKYLYYDDLSDIPLANINSALLEGSQTTSGRLHAPLHMTDTYRFLNEDASCTYLNRHSTSLASSGGAHVTYSTVTELEFSNGQLNGLQVHNFHDENTARLYQSAPRSAPLNGKLLEKKTYEVVGSNLELRQVESNTYSLHQIPNSATSSGFKVHSTADLMQYILIEPVSVPDGIFSYTVKNGFYGGIQSTWLLPGAGLQPQYCFDVADTDSANKCIPGPISDDQKLPYGFSRMWVKQDAQSLEQIDYLGNSMTTSTEFTYEDAAATHFQIEEIKTYDSRGIPRKTVLYYPNDMDHIAMINAHRIGEEVKREYYFNDAKIYTKETVYGQRGLFYVPTQIKVSTGTNTPETRYLITKYDSYGNVIEISKDNGTSLSDHGTVVSYIWGHNGKYPIIKMENARQVDINNALGGTLLQDPLDNSSMQVYLDILKNELPDARMIGYVYDLNAGVSSIFDTNTGVTYFEYDDYNRLLYTKQLDVSGSVHLLSMNNYDITNKYLRTHQYLTPRTTTLSESASLALSNDQASISTLFVDGLGRPVQSVQKGASFHNLDIVQFHEYDGFGRELKQHLPFTTNQNPGGIKTDPHVKQDAFYDSHFGDNSGSYAFTESDVEQSPLNRQLKTYAPGEPWSKTGGNKPIEIKYRTNISSDQVRIWEIGTSVDPVISPTAAEYENANVHGAGTLHVTEIIDENGNSTLEFTNKLGQVILKKVQSGTSSYLSTYYVYDEFNKLRYVLPPEAVEAGTSNGYIINNATMKDYCFYYEYDDRNRMTIKKVPGAGETNGAGEVHIVYDKRDRLVMTQDAEQRLDGEWIFTKYDELNRPGITGIYKDDTVGHDQTYHQTRVNAMLILNLADDDEQANTHKEGQIINTNHYDGTSTIYRAEQHIALQSGFRYDSYGNGPVLAEIQNPIPNIKGTWIDIYYDNTYPEINGAEILTVNYYDNYDFTAENFASRNNIFNNIDGKKPQAHLQVKGQLTGTKTKILGTASDFITSVNFYDDQYQPIQTITTNHKGGKEINTSQFDFAGRLRVTYQEHQNPDADVTSATVKRTYSYDHAGRLLQVGHSLNGGANEVITQNSYNELGELETKDLAGAYQTIDYKYNMRGWLTKMNDPLISDDSKFFSMELKYENLGGGYAQHNGNIGQTIWRNPFDDDFQTYRYQYDALNRLTGADYGIESATTNNHFQVHGISYDSNGNILTLQRKSKGITMDNLDYDYSGNQLIHVEDINGTDEGFKDGDKGTNIEYLYDENGNMKRDDNKGITSITYNYLNLPEKVTFSPNRYIEYTYDAAGIKLSQKVKNISTTKMTDYISGFIYEDDALQLIQHEEGRITYDNGSYDYQYHLKDHLGNVRTTFTPNPDPDDIYTATMEPANDSAESGSFQNLNTRDNSRSAANNTSPGSYSSYLDGSTSVGPAISLKVVPGDVIDVETWAYYEGTSGYNSSIGSSAFITAVAGAFGGVSGAVGEAGDIFDGISDWIGAAGAVNGGGDPDRPSAYLNVILFDEDFNEYGNPIFVQVDDANPFVKHKLSQPNIEIRKSGYMYIYVSMESNSTPGVHFDDLKVTHEHSPIVQKDDYYPFGLTYSSYQKTGKQGNKFKYNGKEEINDLGLNMLDYGARMYDPTLARWTHVDALANDYMDQSPYNYALNNPVIFIDPDGNKVIPFGLSKSHLSVYNKALQTATFSSVFSRLIKSEQHTIRLFSSNLNVVRSTKIKGVTGYKASTFHGESNYRFSRSQDISTYFVNGQQEDGVSGVHARIDFNNLFNAKREGDPNGGTEGLQTAGTLFHEMWHINETMGGASYSNDGQHNSMASNTSYFDEKLSFLEEFKGEGLTDNEKTYHKWTGLVGTDSFNDAMLNEDGSLTDEGKEFKEAFQTIDFKTGLEKK